ncbi:MAG: hypothetical protein N2D54_10575, partial [Chloroflexota bacterium]
MKNKRSKAKFRWPSSQTFFLSAVLIVSILLSSVALLGPISLAPTLEPLEVGQVSLEDIQA